MIHYISKKLLPYKPKIFSNNVKFLINYLGSPLLLNSHYINECKQLLEADKLSEEEKIKLIKINDTTIYIRITYIQNSNHIFIVVYDLPFNIISIKKTFNKYFVSFINHHLDEMSRIDGINSKNFIISNLPKDIKNYNLDDFIHQKSEIHIGYYEENLPPFSENKPFLDIIIKGILSEYK